MVTPTSPLDLHATRKYLRESDGTATFDSTTDCAVSAVRTTIVAADATDSRVVIVRMIGVAFPVAVMVDTPSGKRRYSAPARSAALPAVTDAA